MNEIFFAVLCYLVLQLILVTLIVVAKKTLVSSGDISILINDDKKVSTEPGGKLLTALAEQEIYLSSACGGGGTCGQCRVIVKEGGCHARFRLSMISISKCPLKCLMPENGNVRFSQTRTSPLLSRNWSLNYLRVKR